MIFSKSVRYPVILTGRDDYRMAFVPDLAPCSVGADIKDAHELMGNLKCAAKVRIQELINEKKEIPQPTPLRLIVLDRLSEDLDYDYIIVKVPNLLGKLWARFAHHLHR